VFAIPGIVALLVFIYVRPHELVGGFLTKVPFMNASVGLALFGLAVDLKLRLVKPTPTPQLVWAVLFYLWVLVDLAAVVPGAYFVSSAIAITVSFLLYFTIAHSIQTFKTLQVVALTLVAFTLFLTLVAVHQGLSPMQCSRIIEGQVAMVAPDGRPCEVYRDCYGAEAEPGAEYECEHVGIFGTTSVERRVRYIGVLQDPNELAIAMSCGLALLFGIAAMRRSLGTNLGVAVASALVLVALVMTQSRGGQLVFLSVFGVYFLKRYKLKGAAVGAVLALPVLLLGGRGDAAASMSTEQRLDAWRDGLWFVRQNPLFGVGQGMFSEYHGITAHNAYVLVAAELGVLGMFLWTAVLYASVKILWAGIRDFEPVAGASPARAWGVSLLAALTALLVGINFLSFSYHFVLWIYLGLAGAYYSCIRQHVPSWRVRFGWADAAVVAGLDVAYLVALHVFLRLRGV
jgi:hypothetical protein